jgi:hypothetical protein
MKAKQLLYILIITISFSYSMIFDHKTDLETINRIAKDMNIDQKEEITKEEFRQFFMRVVTKDKQVDHTHFYKSVFKKYMEDVPEVVKTEDLISYVDFDKLKEIMLEIVKEQYGPENAEAVRRKLKEMEDEKEKEEKTKQNKLEL